MLSGRRGTVTDKIVKGLINIEESNPSGSRFVCEPPPLGNLKRKVVDHVECQACGEIAATTYGYELLARAEAAELLLVHARAALAFVQTTRTAEEANLLAAISQVPEWLLEAWQADGLQDDGSNAQAIAMCLAERARRGDR